MDWTKEEIIAGIEAADVGDLDEHAARRIMNTAVYLVAARGGTMTALQRAEWARMLAEDPFLAEVDRHMAAQGATVATLQAKVAELEERLSAVTQPILAEDQESITELVRQGVVLAGANEVAALGMRRLGEWARSGLSRTQKGWGLFPVREQAELRSEVERLKADAALVAKMRRADLAVTKEYAERWKTAESSLAAIRERVENFCALPVRESVERLGSLGARGFARWLLEGDAPREAKVHDIYMCHVENCHDCARAIAQQEAKGNPGDPCVCSSLPGRCTAIRHPCSATCTHSDAATPGHPERVKERSEAVKAVCFACPDETVACETCPERAEEMHAEIERLRAQLSTAQHEVAKMDATLRVVAPELIARLTSSCVWCGEEPPQGMQPEVLKQHIREHVRTCAEHPMRDLEGRIAKLTTAGQVLSEHADRTAGEPAP